MPKEVEDLFLADGAPERLREGGWTACLAFPPGATGGEALVGLSLGSERSPGLTPRPSERHPSRTPTTSAASRLALNHPAIYVSFAPFNARQSPMTLFLQGAHLAGDEA